MPMKLVEKHYSVKLIPEKECKTPTEMEYNQTVLRTLMLKIEAESEAYHQATIGCLLENIIKMQDEAAAAEINKKVDEEKARVDAEKRAKLEEEAKNKPGLFRRALGALTFGYWKA
jgi:hypothetical protein